MINIAFVIDTIATPYAGTEKQLLMLLKHLDRNIIAPHLICLRSSAWLENNETGVPTVILNLDSFKSLQLFKAIKQFYSYCREQEIDVVQTYFRDANIFGTVAAFLAGIKVIISSRRNFGAGYWHNPGWLLILKMLRSITTCYLSNSQLTADYAVKSEGLSSSRIHVIYNGLLLDQFKKRASSERAENRSELNLTEENVMIGILANLRPIKNIELFIAGVNKLRSINDKARFFIIGDGPDRPKIEALISDADLSNHCFLSGQQENVMPFLRAMDIGVLCSHSESLSNSIIEYMAAGIPSVVSNVGGNAEALGEFGGFLFESDNVDDLVSKLDTLINDPILRQKIGTAARKDAFERFDHKSVVKQHEAIYTQYCQ